MPLNFLNTGYFSDKVGIGTNSPGTKLHVGTGSGATVDTGYQIVIDSAGIAGLQILSATNQSGRIVFGDSGDNDIGMIKYDHTDNSMGFRTNGSGSERMRISSTGNVGIGTTTPLAKLDIQGTLGQLFSVTDNLSGEIFAVADISGVPIMSINSNGFINFGSYSGTNQVGTPTYILGTSATGGVVKVLGSDIPGLDDGPYLPLTAGSTKPLTGDLYLGTFNKISGVTNDNLVIGVDINNSSGGSSFDIQMDGANSAFYINNSRNVGIGETSVDARLHISAIASNGISNIKLESPGASKWAFGIPAGQTYFALDDVNDNLTTPKLVVQKTSGNVGIGDTTPSFPLVISKSSSEISNGADNSMRLALSNPDQTNNNYALITFGDGTTQPGSGFFGMQFTDHTNNYGDLCFGTRGASGYGEKMRIDSSGNVGIGTETPGGLFQVNKYTVASQGNQGTFGNISSFANSNVDNIFLGLKNGAYPNRGYAFRTVAAGVNSDFTIFEHGQGTGEVFRIKANGNVGINDTSPDFKLDIGGTFGVSDLPFNTDSVSVLVADETIGAELVTNGDFATDTDWIKNNTNWTISGGSANFTGSATAVLYQGITLTNAVTYKVRFSVSGSSGAGAFIWIGNSQGSINYLGGSYKYYGNGDHIEIFTMPSAQTVLGFYSNATSSGYSLDNVSLKQVTSASDQIQKRELSSDAFGPGNGPYLPLTAGSGFPLTGELYVEDRVVIENTTTLTTGVADSLLIKNLSSGTTITNGFGTAIAFYLENTVYSAVNEVAKISVIETDTTAIDEKMVFSVKDNNILADRLILNGSGGIFPGSVSIGHTANPSNPLDVRGTGTVARFVSSSAAIDQIWVNSGATNYLQFNGSTFKIFQNGGSSGNVTLSITTSAATFSGDVFIKSAALSNQENTAVDIGTEIVAEVSTASFTAAFFDFVIKNGINVRSGTVYACHNGASPTPLIQFTETSTQDLGDTSDVVLSVSFGGGAMQLKATVTSNGWSIKSLIRGI